MNVIVDNKVATLKRGFSFDYISENRLFLGRDGYTLNITFPLKDCPANLAIFGNINRMDSNKEKTVFECSIVDNAVTLNGMLSVVKVTDVEVECQFSEGRCAQVATDPFEDTYINTLNLGAPNVTDPESVTTAHAWRSIDDGAEEVAIPWINTNYPTAPNNWVNLVNFEWSWHPEVSTLSWQPYLIVIAKRICREIGYDFDFSEWEASEMRHIIICNTLPGSFNMPEYANVMPKWTVSEFFEKLELFLMCEFDFDHKAKTVKMRFSKSVLDAVPPICLDDVADAYDAQIAKEDNTGCNYVGAKRLTYKDGGHQMSNFYSCDWFIRSFNSVKHYKTLQQLIDTNKKRETLFENGIQSVEWGEYEGGRLSTVQMLLYAIDVDTYFVFRAIGKEKYREIKLGDVKQDVYTNIYMLQPVNVFGSGLIEDEANGGEEIEFIPVCIDTTYVSKDDDMGLMMFLTPGGMSSAETSETHVTDDVENGSLQDRFSSDVHQPGPASRIEQGDADSQSGYYDQIFVGFWSPTVSFSLHVPVPQIDSFMINQDWIVDRFPGCSLRINQSAPSSPISQLPKIDKRQKFKFSWISNTIPNVRSTFYIKGRRYMCEKITATFTENGMSQLLKGEFWPMVDD